jgi:hypothetical protein
MMEAVSTSETSVDNYFTRQDIPEDNSEQHQKFIHVSVYLTVIDMNHLENAFTDNAADSMFLLCVRNPNNLSPSDIL